MCLITKKRDNNYNTLFCLNYLSITSLKFINFKGEYKCKAQKSTHVFTEVSRMVHSTDQNTVLNNPGIWYVTYSLVDIYQRFGGTCYLHLRENLPLNTHITSTRLQGVISSQMSIWEHKISHNSVYNQLSVPRNMCLFHFCPSQLLDPLCHWRKHLHSYV